MSERSVAKLEVDEDGIFVGDEWFPTIEPWSYEEGRLTDAVLGSGRPLFEQVEVLAAAADQLESLATSVHAELKAIVGEVLHCGTPHLRDVARRVQRRWEL